MTHRSEAGFTLIELLVVILIIGILSAIALPAFLNQTDKARDVAAKTDLRHAVTEIEACVATAPQHNVAATCVPGPNLAGIIATVSFVTPVQSNGAYKLRRPSDSGGTFFIEMQGGSTVVRSCSGGTSGCRNGSW